MTMIEFVADKDHLEVSTRGLANGTQRELVARVRRPDLVNAAEELVRHMVLYSVAERVSLVAGETVAYGGWLLRLQASNDRLRLEALDPAHTETAYDPFVDAAVDFWADQHAVCAHCGSDFDPPRVHHLLAVSRGVLDGSDDVEGVRYPDCDDRSGWVLTDATFDGSVRSLVVLSAGEFSRVRRSIAVLLALPAGYRIRTSAETYDAWFDSSVATAQT